MKAKRRWVMMVAGAVLAGMLTLLLRPSPEGSLSAQQEEGSSVGERCIECHEKENPGLVMQWRGSRHEKFDVACIDCHGAEKGDPDAFEHYDATISIIVSPKDCAGCHEDESAEFQASHHAKAGEILGSLDNVLGEVVEGTPAAVSGCKQCHGSKVGVLEGGKLDPKTWPNTGMGRINPDGSKGSCSACHSRHSFDRAMARRPENCGRCHMGPDHPQKEIYEESKHGIAYRANIEKMNLNKKEWVLGKDYSAAPTCATCHMSTTADQELTHDIGTRISWTLRPLISKKLENWEERRRNMKDVCTNCHSPGYVDSFYLQFDSAIDLYNDKFGKPAQQIMEALRRKGKITPTPFDDEIEWTFFFLWHHEGRRARHGAAMMGPDYTQWHGFYEVAERFYVKLIPQARELAHGDADVIKVIDEVMAMPQHQWKKGMSREQADQIRRFYEKRYGEKGVKKHR